jgi:integrase
LKGSKLWARYKDERGKWKGAPAPYRPGDEAKARGFLKRLENQSDAKRSYSGQSAEEPKGPITVARYADRWVADRKQLGLATASDDLARLRLHVLPMLGEMALEAVRPRHIRDLVLDLRKGGVLAPRTVRHVYATAACMFRTAVADELIPFTPCVLAKGILPKNIDKDASFRANAIFTGDEAQALISDIRILEDRRVLYALKVLAALRHSEASGLRWRQYDTGLEPLGALNLEKTKTQVPRRVPVHPTLAQILRDWREGGWERTYGRPPTNGDFIVPTRNMTERLSPEAQNSFRADLVLLGFRHRRGHDPRRTFITLAQVDGARRDLLETSPMARAATSSTSTRPSPGPRSAPRSPS